ncbi:hypothetical protein ABGN05_26875 [Aquibium sp. LZ166]|uniref:Uncharacterized protein n=1 Tax=Aquibium pacificus TaxID=3153579 RepID=A0ABV3SR43_9HYPH
MCPIARRVQVAVAFDRLLRAPDFHGFAGEEHERRFAVTARHLLAYVLATMEIAAADGAASAAFRAKRGRRRRPAQVRSTL